MPGLFTTMLLVAAVASHTGGPASYDAELKCTARPEADDMPGWVVLLDLELLEGELEDNRERLRERLASLEIAVQTFACWAWLEAHYGAEVRNGAVFILRFRHPDHDVFYWRDKFTVCGTSGLGA